MASDARVLVIRPTRGWRSIDLGELWSYRDLLYVFVWRDIKVRYRQTLLGALWVMGQPLVTMLIFTILFHRVAKLGTGSHVPYPLFVMAGLLLWNFVSAAINHGANSLIGASYLISKVYFPRLLIPLSFVLTDAFDLVVSALLLVPLMLWYGVYPGAAVLLAPLFVLLAGLFATGIGLWSAALNVEYRDIRVIIPWVLQLAMYVTPVVYPLEAVPGRFRWLAVVNPMTGIVEAFRWSLFGTPFDPQPLLWSIAATLFLMVSGAYYFRRTERRFADLL
ncbi:MAG: ABC transporter permease [Acidobacteriota bacterium]|nr:ABC transporter permease [Acidobacteriota bacterium]